MVKDGLTSDALYEVSKITDNKVGVKGYALAADATTLTLSGATSSDKYLVGEKVTETWYKWQ